MMVLTMVMMAVMMMTRTIMVRVIVERMFDEMKRVLIMILMVTIAIYIMTWQW